MVAAEYLAEGVTAPAFMLRHGRFKYVACADDPELLYDLGADPLELHDLAADPATGERVAEFRREAAARWDTAAVTARVLDSQRRRRLVAKALARGAYTPWDHPPPSD